MATRTSPALLRVLTDASLLGHVVSFQRGLPIALFEFWCASDETIRSAAREDRNLIHARHHELLALILTCGGGAIELLDMFKAIRYTDYDHRGFRWSAPSLERVICEAVACHRVDLLQWAIDNGAVYSTSDVAQLWSNALDSFEGNDVDVLDVLFGAAPLDDKDVAFVGSRIRNVASLRWLGHVKPDARLSPTMTFEAVQRGDLEMVRFLYEHRAFDGCTPEAMTEALNRNHEGILEYLLTNRIDALDGRNAASLLTESRGDLHKLVKRFASAFPPPPPYFVWCAVRDRNDSVVDPLIEAGLLTEVSLDEHARLGDLEVVQWIHEKGIATATTDAVDRAMAGKHFDVVLYLLELRSEGCSMAVVREALSNDQAEIVSVLYRKHRHLFDSELLDELTRRGVVDMTVEHPSESLGDEDSPSEDLCEAMLESQDQHTLDLL